MRYIISASDLYQKSKEILNDGMDFVEISFMDPDDDLPAAVHFQDWKKNADYDLDYEEIDVVDSSDE